VIIGIKPEDKREISLVSEVEIKKEGTDSEMKANYQGKPLTW